MSHFILYYLSEYVHRHDHISIHLGWAVYPTILKAIWLSCCSVYPLNFFLIFWISLMFLHMELFRKKWAANSVCAAIIWVDSIYAREYYIANGVWMLQNNNRGGGGVGASECYQTATGEVGCGTQGSTGKQLTTIIPVTGYVPWVISHLLPN